MLPLTTCMDEEMPIISLPVSICVSLCMDSSQHSGAMGRSSSSESTDAQKELMVSFSPRTPGSQSDISVCQQEPTDRPSIVLNDKRVSVKFDAPRSKRLISMTRPKREVNTLIVGLDNAGKTTLLYLLANGAKIPTLPTMGYNQEVLKYDTCALTTRDVSGLHNIRHTWPAHYDGVRALIFVVDATDRARLPEAREELTKVLRHFASVNPGSRDRDPSVRPKEVVSQATKESIAEFGAVPTSESFCTMGTGVSKSSGITSVPIKKKRKSWAARAFHKLTHRTTGNNEDPKKHVLVHQGGEQPSGVPVLIVASKQDKRRAMSAQTLVEEMCLLDMPELADVDWAVVETDYTRVKSPIPGMKWLCKALNERN